MRVRIRRIAKWGCLSLGSMLVVAAAVGNWWDCWFAWFGEPSPRIGVPAAQLGTRRLGLVRLHSSVFVPGVPAIRIAVTYRHCTRAASIMPLLPTWSFSADRWAIQIPTSNVAAFTLGAGVVLWRLDRRRAAHECPKCCYDRRGLAEGALCPECGTTPPPQTPLRASASPR